MVDHHHLMVDHQATEHQAMVKKRDMYKDHQAQRDQMERMERTEKTVNKVNKSLIKTKICQNKYLNNVFIGKPGPDGAPGPAGPRGQNGNKGPNGQPGKYEENNSFS